MSVVFATVLSEKNGERLTLPITNEMMNDMSPAILESMVQEINVGVVSMKRLKVLNQKKLSPRSQLHRRVHPFRIEYPKSRQRLIRDKLQNLSHQRREM